MFVDLTGRILFFLICFLVNLRLNFTEYQKVWNQNYHFLNIFSNSFIIVGLNFNVLSNYWENWTLITLHLIQHDGVSNLLEPFYVIIVFVGLGFHENGWTVILLTKDYFTNFDLWLNLNFSFLMNFIGRYSPTFLKF